MTLGRGTAAITALLWTIGCSAGDPSSGSEADDGSGLASALKSIELNAGSEAKSAEGDVQSVQEELASCNPEIVWCVYPYWGDLAVCHGGVICRSGACSFEDCKRMARRYCGSYSTICNVW
jgi:hypothetical protein